MKLSSYSAFVVLALASVDFSSAAPVPEKMERRLARAASTIVKDAAKACKRGNGVDCPAPGGSRAPPSSGPLPASGSRFKEHLDSDSIEMKPMSSKAQGKQPLLPQGSSSQAGPSNSGGRGSDPYSDAEKGQAGPSGGKPTRPVPPQFGPNDDLDSPENKVKQKNYDNQVQAYNHHLQEETHRIAQQNDQNTTDRNNKTLKCAVGTVLVGGVCTGVFNIASKYAGKQRGLIEGYGGAADYEQIYGKRAPRREFIDLYYQA